MSIVSANENLNRQLEANEDNEDFNQNFVDENEQNENIENKQFNLDKGQTGLNTTSSSGIGSIGSPNFEPNVNNSIYTAYGSNNTNGSIPATPSTPPSSYDTNSCDSSHTVPAELINKLNLGQNLPRNGSNENLVNQNDQSQDSANQMYFQGMNNFHSLPIGLGNNSQFDYDLFNGEYTGIDKQLAMQMNANQNVLDSVIGNKKNIDAQKQQLLVQAIAAATASGGAYPNTPNSAANENQSKINQRSLMENIEHLNSKFLNHKQQFQQDQNNMNKNANFNSLLAAAASLNQNGNMNDSMTNTFGSPNQNLKRQSAGAFINPNVTFSTPIPASTSPTNSNLSSGTLNNNRLNSTPTIPANEQSRFYSRNQGNTSPDKMNSMSASNSSFNLDIGNNNSNASVNSGYDDDDVFTNSSLNFNQNQNNPLLMANQNFDMYQLYRSLLASNMNTANINELLMNQSQNLSNLSISSATDILNSNNSNNFLNLSGSNNTTFNQMKMNSFNQANNSNSNNNNNINNSLNNQLNLSPVALAAAVLKQRQNNQMMNNQNRISNGMMNNQGNNVNQSNMASFLNSQNQQMMNSGNDVKRRINSIATAYNLGSNGNHSPLFPSASTHNVGPNASQLLQQSSLVSSARLNSSAANQSTASVLGNNSSLSHTLNSLQHQSNQMMPNPDAFGSLNSSPLPSNNHNLFSALSLSSSAGTSLTNTLLSSSGKPLRSERLPPQMVEEIIKQGKIRRKQGGKKEVCVFCRNNGEKEQFFASHTLKDAQNNVACPVLRLYQCPICHANGDQAHTIKYCPYAEKDSPKLKEFGRFSAAAALLMNSFNGGNTPPAGSPPETPSPLNQTPSQSHQLSFLSQSVSPNISSPNNPFAQALNQFNNFNNFNLSNACLQTKTNDLNLSLNKSTNQLNNSLLTGANPNITKSN